MNDYIDDSIFKKHNVKAVLFLFSSKRYEYTIIVELKYHVQRTNVKNFISIYAKRVFKKVY
jgi:hypothetical protein